MSDPALEPRFRPACCYPQSPCSSIHAQSHLIPERNWIFARRESKWAEPQAPGHLGLFALLFLQSSLCNSKSLTSFKDYALLLMKSVKNNLTLKGYPQCFSNLIFFPLPSSPLPSLVCRSIKTTVCEHQGSKASAQWGLCVPLLAFPDLRKLPLWWAAKSGCALGFISHQGCCPFAFLRTIIKRKPSTPSLPLG